MAPPGKGSSKPDETNHELAEDIFEQVARIGKAVASPKRLEILELLSQAPRTVDAIAHETRLSQANTSQHLRVLRACNLVSTRRDGTSIWYSLTDKTVAEFFRILRVLATTHLAELDRIVGAYFSDFEGTEAVDQKTLRQRVRNGEVTIVDVRPKEEFDAGHIPGAISIPIEEVDLRIDELPKEKEIVAYCRGPYCVWSGQAVRIFRQNGYSARHLRDGILDWRARGYRVQAGAPARTN